MPPLRQRKDDISLLAEYYLNHFSQTYNRSVGGFSDAALHALRSYEWPGNVRELINVVERAVIICLEKKITTHHLPFENSTKSEEISNLNLMQMEKFYMELALKRTTGNKTRAARLLGVSRKTLIDKAKKYRLE
jgi:DNA-binding NtrC family response regulator